MLMCDKVLGLLRLGVNLIFVFVYFKIHTCTNLLYIQISTYSSGLNSIIIYCCFTVLLPHRIHHLLQSDMSNKHYTKVATPRPVS